MRSHGRCFLSKKKASYVRPMSSKFSSSIIPLKHLNGVVDCGDAEASNDYKKSRQLDEGCLKDVQVLSAEADL